jgi:O-succinylbenzoic acid--CoA ligase
MMTVRNGIYVGTSFFDSNAMRTVALGQAVPGLSAEAVAALTFCHQWLEGQETFVFRTSGSTGFPKPVTISKGQILTSVEMTTQAIGLKSSYRALVCLSPRYVAGIMMLARGLILGMEMVFVDPAGNPFEALHGDFDFTALVPLQVAKALDSGAGRAHLNRMKVVLVGGAPLPAALEAKLREVSSCDIYHTFGMTETVSHVALRLVRHGGEKNVYSALPGVELSIGERGCLVINSPLTGKPVETNDLVDLLSNKQFRWLGRIDNVINSAGIKVSAERVEGIIEEGLLRVRGGMAHEVAVVGMPDKLTGEKIVACVEGLALPQNLLDQFKELISRSLGKYESPREYRFLRALPRLESGKIDRDALKTLIATRR